jgi:hypothetical protein
VASLSRDLPPVRRSSSASAAATASPIRTTANGGMPVRQSPIRARCHPHCCPGAYSAGEVIVGFERGTARQQVEQIVEQLGASALNLITDSFWRSVMVGQATLDFQARHCETTASPKGLTCESGFVHSEFREAYFREARFANGALIIDGRAWPREVGSKD